MSESLRPHELRNSVRLLCPWNSPGKNTGVGCHFLFQRPKLLTYPQNCLLDAILLSLSLPYPNKTIKANPSKRFEACHVTIFVLLRINAKVFTMIRKVLCSLISPTWVFVSHYSHPLALFSHTNFPPIHPTWQACPYHRTSVSTII